MPQPTSRTRQALCLIAALASAAGAASAMERKVLIIGIDGVRPDALIAANTPAIDSLIAHGAASYTVQAEDISLSGPCWSTILTGVHRNKHLVNSNSFMPADFNAYPHFFARVRENCPDLRKATIVHWAPINQKIALGQADLIQTFATDLEVRNAAVAELSAPAFSSADITFLHFDDVDHAGHASGFSPTVPQYIAALESTDAHIAQVIAAVQARPTYANEDWLVVLCSDHGGSGTTHGANTPEQRTTFFVFSGPSAQQNVTLAGPMTLADIAPTLMRFLGISVDPAWGWDGNAVGLNMAASPSQPVSCGNEARVTLLAEDFESVTLGSSVNEAAATNVWTDTPPAGWTVDDSGIPAVNNPSVGVTEWKGWAFTRKTWWSTVTQDQGRSQFTSGLSTVAVADPDEWDDRGSPAPSTLGPYNARMSTPTISLASAQPNSVRITFDASWRQEGQQRALLTARFDSGAPITLLEWSSVAGATFKPDTLNEAVRITVPNPAGATTMRLEFALLDARNNWWWTIDNLTVDAARGCDSIDFNRNGVFPEDQDVVDFFDVLAGGICANCADIDFNNNQVFPEDQDVIDFFNTLAGGTCP
ncbi:MAG: alkaline phosphatase family protein [Phycisphaerae bacterium]